MTKTIRITLIAAAVGLAVTGETIRQGLSATDPSANPTTALRQSERSIAQADAELLEKANVLYREGKFDQAIPLYRKVEERRAFPLQAAFNLGNSYYQLGDFPKAAAAYRKATRLGEAENLPVLLNMGSVLYRLGMYGEAVAAYHRALRLDPDNTQSWLFLAECYQRTGDLVGAQKAFEKVLLQPDADVSAAYQLAEIYVSQKNYDQALNTAKMGLARFPEDNDFWFYIGDLYRLKGDNDGALAAYRQGLLNQPKNHEVYYKMADVAANSKRFAMAIDYCEKALAVKPDFVDAMIFLGNLAYDLKWRDRAQAAYLKAAQAGNPEGAQGILNIAVDLSQEGQNKLALSWLAPLLKLDLPIPLRKEIENLRADLLNPKL